MKQREKTLQTNSWEELGQSTDDDSDDEDADDEDADDEDGNQKTGPPSTADEPWKAKKTTSGMASKPFLMARSRRVGSITRR